MLRKDVHAIPTEKYPGVVDRRFWSADSDIHVCSEKITAIQPIILATKKKERERVSPRPTSWAHASNTQGRGWTVGSPVPRENLCAHVSR